MNKWNTQRLKHFIVFDVLINGHWLNWKGVCEIANDLGLKTVPFLGEKTLDEGIELVKNGFDSILAKETKGAAHQAEGLVGRTSETLYDKFHKRLILKLKTRDF